MKTSVMDVRDMLSVLSVTGVEDSIVEVAGVESATVNFAAGNATVRYDETRIDVADIKSDIRQRGSASAAHVEAPTPGMHKNPNGHAETRADPVEIDESQTPQASNAHAVTEVEGDASRAPAAPGHAVKPVAAK